MSETTIEQDLKIDLLDLAADASRQPGLYHKWATRYAEAHSIKVKIREAVKIEKIRAKQVFDERRAEIEADIRANWDSYSSEKKTEGGVQTLLANHQDFKKAQEQHLLTLAMLNQQVVDATHEDLILEAARDAMQQRQQSIKTATDLYLGGYFSDTGFDKRELNKAEKEANQNAQVQLKSRLKKRGT